MDGEVKNPDVAVKQVPLPSESEITVRWLLDHIPLRWWFALACACASVVAAAFWGGQQFAAVRSASEVRDRMAMKQALENDIADLTAKKAQLEATLTRLQIDVETSQMTPAEVRESLRRWAR